MPVEVILPKVDMDMESGTIERWAVGEGDVVSEGQLLFEIGTSKAVMEVDSPASGVIRRISAKAGETITVGAAVAWIYRTGEVLTDAAAVAGPVPAIPVVPSEPGQRPPQQERAEAPGLSLRATPLARRVARLEGVDLGTVPGSGPKGRIHEADVLASIAARGAARSDPGLSCATPVGQTAPAPGMAPPSDLVPFSAVRRIVAERLTASARTAPHFFVSSSIDMTAATGLLAQLGERRPPNGSPKPSMTAFLTHAVGRILPDHPYLNAAVEGDAVRLFRRRDIGIAMDRDGDLVVPVLRGAGDGSLQATVVAFERLKAAVTSRGLKPSDMEGGTFTISNLGMFGVDSFTAIINPPQTGILAVGRSVDTPVGVNGRIELRRMCTFCLSSDHRAVDGVTAAKFMADLRCVIESPTLLI